MFILRVIVTYKLAEVRVTACSTTVMARITDPAMVCAMKIPVKGAMTQAVMMMKILVTGAMDQAVIMMSMSEAENLRMNLQPTTPSTAVVCYRNPYK